jgi:sigma-B regulation protein RsbU (phosphoserine phosphatase)
MNRPAPNELDSNSIRQADQQLALITDALPVMVSYVDSAQRYLFLNRTFERWFGRSRVEAIGKTVREVMGDSIYGRLSDSLTSALRGETTHLSLRASLPQLGERDLEVTFTPDFAPDGTVRGTVDLVTDVTERRGLESEQARLVDELTRTVKLNQLFAGILSHDLRNPLGAILMSATVLSRKVGDEGLKRTLGRILTAGNRMNRMIAQLLDFTWARAAGGLQIERARADIATIFRQAIEELSENTGGRAVSFEHAGETGGWWDADRLAQAASNLVGNAVRHGTADGAIGVRIDGVDSAHVTVAVTSSGTIPSELLPLVFEPFQSGQLRSRKGGLGLGLFITREIAQAHLGTLEVLSALDTTTFTMSLPRGSQPALT